MDLALPSLAEWHIAVSLPQLPDAIWAALVSAIVTLALSTAVFARRAAAAPDGAAAAEEPGACDFLLNGSTVRPLTGPARALLDGIPGRKGELAALTRHLERDAPSIASDLEALVLYGAAFRRTCLRADGSSYEIAGRPRGGAALLSVRPASADSRALDEAERALARARDDAAFLRHALDRAPILVWTLGPDRHVLWANAAYRERFDLAEADLAVARRSCAFAHLLEEVPLTGRPGCESRRRVKIAPAQEDESYWYEVSQVALPSGGVLCYAVEVDDLVAAEASLRRFVETLTETFAHLPIGLAVFDKNRRLGLFNPALSDLVKIDAVWLAGRPTLRDFLERLRETRQMPEQKDFAAFRRMLTTLEEGARDGTYEENWQLPSGKIFRVTGRPHPQGALAFLFEDISPAIHLERRYRAELELSQATLDRMNEAVAVFDTSGMLVFVNSAFETLWGLDPMERLDGPTVAELAGIWEERCLPSPLWSDLRAFATGGADSRTSWTGEAVTLEGRTLALLVAPLPNGSTLVTFHGAAPADAGDAAAAAGLAAAAEAALAALGPAIASAHDARAFGGLTEAARRLRDALARRRDPADAERGASPLADRLAGLLRARGLSLAAAPAAEGTCDPATDWSPALGALVMAAAGLAPAGAALALAERHDGAGPSLALTIPGLPAEAVEPEPRLLALARRRLAAAGGALAVAATGEGVVLTAVAVSGGEAAAVAAQ